MMRCPLALAAVLLALAGPALAAGPAEDDTAAEIGLWQAVTARGLPSDYEGYLLLFPQGRFAALARLRLQGGSPPPAPTPPAGVNLYRLEVMPAVAARGQAVTVRTHGFLPPALYDLVVVVRAGTPDFTPAGALDDAQMAAKSLAHLYDGEHAGIPLFPIPALTPGSYEVRYVSRQYNPDGRNEVLARAGLTVR